MTDKKSMLTESGKEGKSQAKGFSSLCLMGEKKIARQTGTLVLGVEDKRILIRGTSSPQDSMCERKNALFK